MVFTTICLFTKRSSFLCVILFVGLELLGVSDDKSTSTKATLGFTVRNFLRNYTEVLYHTVMSDV